MRYGQSMHGELDRLYREMAAALSGLSAAQTQARPTAHPEKWSIQQIVEHLCRTYHASVPAIQGRVEKGTSTRAVPSLQQRLGQFFLISLGQFPRGREAPEAVWPPLPSDPVDGAELCARVRAALEPLDEVIEEGERIFGKARAASHMILGPLSMQQWRRFHLIHGRHHVKQIWEIRRQGAL